jgi:cell division protein FtsI (penicillin-binding protein 3)
MDFKKDKIIPYYVAMAILLVLGGVAVVGKAAYTMFAQREFWEKVSSRQVADSLEIQPVRGNIFSSDGQLMASSLPEFKVYMDFHAYDDSIHLKKTQAKKDSLLLSKMDSICWGLNRIFPDKSAKMFRKCIQDGKKKMSRHWLLYDKRISYTQFRAIRSLPFFKLGRNISGLHVDTFNMRKKPFGSLASRTVGDIFGRIDLAKNGLELAYDSILRGIPGLQHRKKVRNRYIPITDKEPVEGYDLVSTIDVGMQDVAEQALVNKLKEVNGEMGIVVLMEAATGDVKAIVNMTKCEDGEYHEIKNDAVADLRESGSTFKTASILVALDDGVIDTTDHVDACGGRYMMHGREMKDHNWHRGGYGVLSVPEVLMFSSNIGVSRLIDEHYADDPARFVRGLYRVGIAEDLHLPLVGSAKPWVRMPKRNPRRPSEWLNWSHTALPWMSIGYESQIPPINICTFYNAIANGGKMVRPKFVKCIMRNGEVVEDFPPEVVKEKICSSTALSKIQAILRRVVRDGLGKKAGNPTFPVSGKTGTAQVSQGARGYKAGGTNYYVSFCGYFPSDAPKYTCLVAIQKCGSPASGGGQCGPVFREISEAVMSKHAITKQLAEAARDTLHCLMPAVKNGDIAAADYVLAQLGIQHICNGLKPWRDQVPNWNKMQQDNIDAKAQRAHSYPVWGRTATNNTAVNLTRTAVGRNIVPDVTGMGAKDALYLLESCGLRVSLAGRGAVVQQSLPYGHHIVKGEVIKILLEQKGNCDLLPQNIARPATAGTEEVVDESGAGVNSDTTAAKSTATKKKSTEQDAKKSEVKKEKSIAPKSAAKKDDKKESAKKTKSTSTEKKSSSDQKSKNKDTAQKDKKKSTTEKSSSTKKSAKTDSKSQSDKTKSTSKKNK